MVGRGKGGLQGGPTNTKSNLMGHILLLQKLPKKYNTWQAEIHTKSQNSEGTNPQLDIFCQQVKPLVPGMGSI